MLRGKKILVGVCGSIAAYKTAVLVRLLVKAGAQVRVVMTPAAREFITPLTLATLSGHPVLSDFANADDGTWHNHVELGLWADVLLIAPATANTMAKLAQGQADNLLGAVYLSARCPVVLAPAMDLDMYRHPATQAAIQRLEGYGNHLIAAEHGELASGLTGTGRMAEPEHIVDWLENFAVSKAPLRGKKVLITAGPTYEPIDPVRFVGNHSSGKMGLELALQAKARGADVTLVLGPNTLPADKLQEINVVNVITAQQMYEACRERFDRQDVVILAAAVADYTPRNPAGEKIKKKKGDLQLKLAPTIDIAQSLGKDKKHQFMVGFALETENGLEHAREKLQRKNLDFIVLNSLTEPGAGFGYDTNKITIVGKDNKIKEFQLKSKTEVAKDIIDEIISQLA